MATAVCQARNVSDELPCKAVATANENKFCNFHSRQCYGLYRGYKLRNAELDALVANPPKYLTGKKTLASRDFADVEDESALREIHDHLFKRYNLLDRVIRARRLHHSRFFVLDLDYGHELYLNQLNQQKFTVIRALERLEKRTAEVLYKKQKWFKWVRQCQDDEEKQAENEKEKVKREAALFRRQWKQVEQRIRVLRAKEEQKRQDAYLDKAYEERMLELDDMEDSDWDPIEDFMDDKRGTYIDLIRHFLWSGPADTNLQEAGQRMAQISITGDVGEEQREERTENPSALEPSAIEDEKEGASKKKKKKNKKKATANVEQSGQSNSAALVKQAAENAKIPDKSKIETEEELRTRLSTPQLVVESNGPQVAGTIQNPIDLMGHAPALVKDEIDSLVSQIVEIKHLLFCRLLLTHATLLPIALRADSVDAFLADAEVSEADLRDLCLQMEQPDLQQVRDACADLTREDEHDDIEMYDEEEEEYTDLAGLKEIRMFDPRIKRRGAMPETWKPKREGDLGRPGGLPFRTNHALDEDGVMVDFGELDDKGEYSKKKMRVKICGRFIWNYASQSAMSRSGWLQFSIIAGACSLYDAIQLCRNWDEFFELNILTLFHYFPVSRWRTWSSDRLKQELLQQGFIPYHIMSHADSLTYYHQTGSRSQYSRQHHQRQARNYICAHMKRSDPVTRRFVQYLSMKSSCVCVLVRDGRDGRIVVKPPEEQLFLVREKSGRGRASKNEWTDVKVVGEDFFEEMDQKRTWHFGFKDYYDIYVWDTCPGDDFEILYRTVHETLLKARRATGPREMHLHLKPILSTLTRDKETARARDIRPGSGEESIYDDMTGPKTRFMFGKAFTVSKPEELTDQVDPAAAWALFYNEADALEDMILFPDESNLKVGEIETRISKFEREGPILSRFVNDLDVDEHLSDYDISDDSSSEGGFLVRPGDDQDLALKQLEDEADEDEDEWEDESEGTAELITRALANPNEIIREVQDEWSEEEGDENSMVLDVSEESRFGWNEGICRLMLQATIADMGGPSARTARIVTFRNSPAYAVLRKWHKENEIVNREEGQQDPHNTFMEWMERDRSKHFKEMFHACDIDPDSIMAYNESMNLVKSLEQHEMGSLKRAEYCFLTLDFLGVKPGIGSRRALRDVVRAYVMIAPFFPGLPDHSIASFLASKYGKRFQGSKLFEPSQRTQVPNQRSHTSNRYRPKDFWKEWKDIENDKKNKMALAYAYPQAWDKLARPILAKFYKEGLIQPRYTPANRETGAPGMVICNSEPGRGLDIYFDYTIIGSERFDQDRRMVHPDKYPDLLQQAKTFASKHTKARFALLRIWSSPYFWPLMLGHDNRDFTSFVDGQERCWEFKFVPKDMYCSEWSIHYSIHTMLEKFAKPLGYMGMEKTGNIAHRRDIILVMGTDEEDLMRRVVGTTFAVQGRPWLREVDLARSFINVDEAFLDNLDSWWFD